VSTPFELDLHSEYLRADLFLAMGQPTEAARILTAVVEFEADNEAALELLARAYFGSAQLGRAESVLRALVEERPDDGYLHLLLGRTLQRQRRHDDARRHLTLAQVLGGYERPTAYGEVVVPASADEE